MRLYSQTDDSFHLVPPARFDTLTRAIGVSILSLASLFLSGGKTLAGQEIGGTMVAAGFGYQIGDVSTITVKMYDALTGEVLTEEVFDLSINEGEVARSLASHERIIAGGVGPGAADLSKFMVRVYDATTGRFQWEGELNLKPAPAEGTSGHRVSTVTARRAAVTPVHRRESSREPLFLLRALDSESGGLLWEDQFSAGSSAGPKLERIAIRSAGWEVGTGSQTFDFRIQMVDRGRVLWEDQFAQPEPEDDAREAADERATVLPAWPSGTDQDAASRDL